MTRPIDELIAEARLYAEANISRIAPHQSPLWTSVMRELADALERMQDLARKQSEDYFRVANERDKLRCELEELRGIR